MSFENQRRPAAVATVERLHRKTRIEQDNNSMVSKSCQGDLIEYLFPGAENATGGGELVKLLGLSSRRELQRIVADARRSGAVVLANSRGYYLPGPGEQGQAEVADFAEFIACKAASVYQAGESARRYLRENVPGQITMTTAAEIGGGD